MKKIIIMGWVAILTVLCLAFPVIADTGWGNGAVYGITQLVDKVEELDARVAALENPEPETTPVISGFTHITTLYDMDALQGVASDGTYLYNTGATATHDHYWLYKRHKDGTLIKQLDYPNLYGTEASQVNGISAKDGLLYVGSFEPYGGPDVTRRGFIKVFDADLNYITEHEVKEYLCEGAAFHNGYWWVIYHHVGVVSRYTTEWTWVADYPLSYLGNSNGIIWIGDYAYINNHDGSSDTLDCYLWTGTGFEAIKRIDRPVEYSQGICLEPGQDLMWWAQRHVVGGVNTEPHNIVLTTIDF